RVIPFSGSSGVVDEGSRAMHAPCEPPPSKGSSMHRFAFPGRRPALGAAVRGTLLSVALAAALPLPAARAAEPAAAAQPRAYAIAPGPMGDVLAVFAATAGVS